MKKNFKFIPVALGLLALASCNSNDFEVNDTQIIKKDGALTVITDVDYEGDASMRSAVGYARITDGSNKGTLFGVVFTDGDKIKVYDQDNWRYQTWVKSDETPAVNGTNIQTIFELDAEEGDKYALTDGGYAVYPNTLAAFANEERTKLTITNFVSEDGELTLEEIEGGQYPKADKYTYLNDNTKLFNCPVPMWGKANNGVVALSAMVGLLKVNFTGVEVEEGAKIVVTADEDKALWAPEVQVDFDFDGEDAAPAVDADALVAENVEKQNVLTINLPAFDGDTYLLIPVAAGEYESLKIEYFAADNSTETATKEVELKAEDGEYEVVPGILKDVVLTVSANAELEAPITPVTLQNALADGDEKDGHYNFADFGRNVEVDLKGALQVGGTNHKPEFTTLTLPVLKNNVTFNLTQGIATMENGTDPVLTITGGSGSTGKLIINIASDQTSTADIVVDADVEVEINNLNSTALEKEVTVNGKTTLKGNYTTVNTTSDYTIGEGVGIATALNAGGTLTVKSPIEGVINTSYDVAIAKGKTVASLVLGSDEEDAAAVSAINLTVAEEPAAAAEDATAEAAYATVTELTVNKVTKVNATDISIGTITKTAETTATEIHTEGVSEITEQPVDADNLLSFSSVYDGSVAPNALPNGSSARYIYTAAQLAKVGIYGGAMTWHLKTNITSAANAKWNSITIGSGGQNKSITFNGNGNTIDGVALEGEGENIGMFNLSMSETTTVTIMALKVENLSYTGTEEVNGVGALVGIVKGGKAVNITNVDVKGTSIGSTAENSRNIGGLIGQVDGAVVTLTGSKLRLTDNIVGHYNLGGTIGSVTNGAEVTIKTSPIVIGDFDVYNNEELSKDDLKGEEEEHAKYGTVGMVIGSILSTDNTVTLGTEGSTAGVDLFSGNKRSTAAQKKALHFDYNFKYASNNGKKSWYSGGLSAVGYSPKMVELDEQGNEKANGQSSTVTYLGKEYKASSINSYTTTAY